jgi:hypothetical protein
VRDRVRPINTKKGKDMNWGEEVDKEVMELRKQLTYCIIIYNTT